MKFQPATCNLQPAKNTCRGRVFCVSLLQIAIADTDAMGAIEMCMKQEEMSLFSEIYGPFTAITVK